MAITLHHVPQSRSMRVLWLLHELAVEFDLETHPFDKSLREEPFRSLHPGGRVPVLELDGQVIRESGAMIEVLCERFDPRGLGRPTGHRERPKWLEWVHFAESLSQHCAILSQQHIFLRDDAMRSPTLMKLEAARLGRMLRVVEEGLAGDYLLASGFSAADVAVGQAAYMARHFVTFDHVPGGAEWMARLQARDGFQASLPEPGTGLYARDFYPPLDDLSDG